jgi:hypothetical protein
MVVQRAPETSALVPSWVTEALSWVGLRWPEGDTGRLTAAGDAWLEFGRTLAEQHRTAGMAAQMAWAPPHSGEYVDTFKAWWNAETGPGTNLLLASGAAAKIGAALRGLSIQIIALRAVFIADLALMATTLVAAGLLVVGTAGIGSVAVAAGGSFVVNRVRRTMMRRLQVTVTAVGAMLIVNLLRKAADDLVPVATLPGRGTRPDLDRRTRPTPDPADGPRPPPPFPIPWRPDDEPRCQMPPNLFLPRQPPVLVGNPDPRTAGGYIIRIEQQINGTVRMVTIDGVMHDPLPPTQRLGTPQYELQVVRSAIGLPPGSYDACHTYGPGFGSEAAAGMALCPTSINNNPGAMFDAEERLRNLYRSAPTGSWVELHTETSTHPTPAWPDPQSALQLPSPANQPAGSALLHRVDYTATVCQPGRVVDVYNFGIQIDAPTLRNGVYNIPGTATVYGRLPPR